MIIMVFVMVLRPVAIVMWLLIWGVLHGLRLGALDYLVQLPPIKPYSTAFRTVVYFHTLPFGDFQIYSCAYGTFHDGVLL
ncbi:hypothetical protein RW64_11735 [Geobacter sulfurreducens]|jgi:hypothetical protein|nr:hypothetical protein RW64_11735 [Geobacter sulfurreducens]